MSEAAALPGLELVSQGKVRDIYAAGDDRLLMVVSDRISTYDVVHPTPIPDKGKMLTGLTAFWLAETEAAVPQPPRLLHRRAGGRRAGAAMLVERLEMVPVECVVRGLHHRARAGRTTRPPARSAASSCPAGLRESEQLPEPIFTPATKAELGDHDENVDFDRAAEIVGDRRAARGAAPAVARDLRARRRATRASAGSSWPTPSSSSAAAPTGRSCSATRCSPPTPRASGRSTATSRAARSRASTSSSCATGRPARAGTSRRPRRRCPPEVVEGTRARYQEAYERITGEPFSAWLERSGG